MGLDSTYCRYSCCLEVDLVDIVSFEWGGFKTYVVCIMRSGFWGEGSCYAIGTKAQR